MSRKRKNERRTVVVDGKLQARIVLSNSLPMIACLVFAVGVEWIYRRQVAVDAVSSDGTLFGMPEHRLGMLLLFVSASMTQLVSALLSSQKVAGTSYRIAQVLSDFRRGDATERVHLRKGDYQVRLADDINEFLDWVAARGPAGAPSSASAGGSAAAAGAAGGDALASPGAFGAPSRSPGAPASATHRPASETEVAS